jgi:CRISPR-associated protein Cas6
MRSWEFSVQPGAKLKQDCGYTLLSALSRRFPWMHGKAGLQIAPLAGRRVDDDHKIETDARTVLHVRGISREEADRIAGSWCLVESVLLAFGEAREVLLTPHSRLISRLVLLEDVFDRDGFEHQVRAIVGQEGAQITTGHRRALEMKGRHFLGWSVTLRGLDASTSLHVLEHGIGRHRSMGCGVFGGKREGARREP